MSTIPSWLEVNAGEQALLANTPISPPSIHSMATYPRPSAPGGLPAQNGVESPIAFTDLAGASGVAASVGTLSHVRRTIEKRSSRSRFAMLSANIASVVAVSIVPIWSASATPRLARPVRSGHVRAPKARERISDLPQWKKTWVGFTSRTARRVYLHRQALAQLIVGQ